MFLLYKSKLNPTSDRLWQRPRQGNINYIDETWYEQRHVGHDPLERFMKYLSSDAKLSMTYTNHSIRATVITTLDKCGFEARHITAISGHKNESTIKTYSTKCPESKKREMNDTLKRAVNQPKKIKCETVPNPSLPTLNVQDLEKMGITTDTTDADDGSSKVDLPPNFELMPFDDDDAILLKFLDENLPQEVPTEVEKTTEESPGNASNQAVPTTPTDENVVAPSGEERNVQTTNNTSTSVMNKTSAMPIIPKMLFNKSHVTINYHIHQK